MNTANVLLVDDSVEMLELYRVTLGDLGLNLVTAQTGEEALKLVKDTDFAVIVLDIQMPGIDGYETASRIRNLEKYRQTPIIFVTGNYKDDQSAARGYALGAADYLTKPFRVDAFRGKVTAYVDLFNRTRAVMEQIRSAVPVAARDKILVAHEELAQLIAKQGWSEKLGVEMIVSSSVQDCISLLKQHEVALILLGAALRDGESLEVVRFIRQNDPLASAPVILVTNTSQTDQFLKRGYELGVVDILAMPVNPDLLRAKVQALLNQFRQIRTMKQQYREIERLKQEIESTRKRLLDIETELDRLAGLAV